MYGEEFKPGDRVRVLSEAEIEAHYGEKDRYGGYGLFVASMIQYCEKDGIRHEFIVGDTSETDDPKSNGITSARSNGEACGTWWFPDFSITRADRPSEKEVLSDWLSLMNG